MKKIIAIAFAAIIAGLAISCQKEEAVSDKTDAVQYTFNITVNDRSGFDNGASTKGDATYKSAWENGDKIFLFFKPTEGSLLDDKYATLTYNGSSWDGTVSSGTSSLGDGGTLSAVYVYKLGSNVTPSYSDSKWIIATGNTFYNCQTGVTYTVSGDVISATLNLVAPTNFVQFYVTSATGALTCDQVKGWKDIAIGSDMAISNVTCTGYMDGFDNSGDSNVKEYYGRIVNNGTSLENKDCKFSVVKNGKVYEHTATPSSNARSFTMMTTSWTEAPGKLPGLFTVGKGADYTAGTADDVQVRFSKGNLVATINLTGTPTDWKFAANQYDCLGEGGANKTIGSAGGNVDLFGWSTTTTYGINTSQSDADYSGEFKDWGTAIDDKGTWRTLSKSEWEYLIGTRSVNDGTGAGKSYSINITYGGKAGLVLYPDNYTGDALSGEVTTLPEGVVFLPEAGTRAGSILSSVNDLGKYWSSSKNEASKACYLSFNSSEASVETDGRRYGGSSVRLVTDVE